MGNCAVLQVPYCKPKSQALVVALNLPSLWLSAWSNSIFLRYKSHHVFTLFKHLWQLSRWWPTVSSGTYWKCRFQGSTWDARARYLHWSRSLTESDGDHNWPNTVKPNLFIMMHKTIAHLLWVVSSTFFFLWPPGNLDLVPFPKSMHCLPLLLMCVLFSLPEMSLLLFSVQSTSYRFILQDMFKEDPPCEAFCNSLWYLLWLLLYFADGFHLTSIILCQLYLWSGCLGNWLVNLPFLILSLHLHGWHIIVIW